MRIGLLRHGRTDWNRAGLLQGQTNRPLEEGEPERLATLALPPEWADAAVIASPLRRAAETARIVTGSMPPLDARLTEMSFGTWEGQRGKELRTDPHSGFRDLEYWSWDYRPPSGESPREVWARVSAALGDVRQDTLIVCHMVVMRVILAKAHGWNFEGHQPFLVKRDRIYGVTVSDGVFAADAEPIRLVERCA